uniref:Uncharacterized protein n=1 Tax=Arion vulgaris TaxID=1028688 RepID=A0A0B7AW89_9EUPU
MYACILSDSLSIIQKMEAGLMSRKEIESLQRSTICIMTFIFVLEYIGVNETANRPSC